MKPSNITTPRTLAETTFTTGYTSGELDRPFDWQDRVVMIACAVAAVAVAVIMVVRG